ncbi:unnamed protein product [Periconia digitata]|uniref:Uncharacterized protein n=1 Tax=Periconia digitata TaxID=1303443 RepID=A0A9W4UUC5_9PLEO|nr:unnamed protein product [Periconia digitata]
MVTYVIWSSLARKKASRTTSQGHGSRHNLHRARGWLARYMRR